tara:strand:- start:130 stop:300 length:171 start_codon:yes stop_codon:yes gene_type:complete
MTKAQARKRLMEAKKKIAAVYMETWSGKASWDGIVLSVKDMETIGRILGKATKKLK